MARTIGGGDVGKAIADALKEYTDAVSEGIRKEVDDAAKDIKTAVMAASPVGATGKYRKGWAIYKADSHGVTTRIIHNKSRYMLVHLLEHGHAKRGGGRAAAIPHVAPAAEPRIQKMEANIKRIIENGG
jgi:hypothetical protein